MVGCHNRTEQLSFFSTGKSRSSCVSPLDLPLCSNIYLLFHFSWVGGKGQQGSGQPTAAEGKGAPNGAGAGHVTIAQGAGAGKPGHHHNQVLFFRQFSVQSGKRGRKKFQAWLLRWRWGTTIVVCFVHETKEKSFSSEDTSSQRPNMLLMWLLCFKALVLVTPPLPFSSCQ